MALQTTGAISLGDVEGEFGGSAPTSLSEYYSADTGVPASGEISLSDFYGTSNRVTINLAISANTNNYNIYTQASADPTYSAGKTDVILTVNARLGSTSTSNPSLDTGVFASGDTIKLVNNDRIMGKGGLGGNGGNSGANAGANGGNGGTAIKLQFPITIDNQDRINGGAGGGGGGGGAYGRGRQSTKHGQYYTATAGGGGGGGGAGRTQSAGGSGGSGASAGTAGSNSTQLNGGAGGSGGSYSVSYASAYGGDGGDGGGQGANGSNGTAGSASGNYGTTSTGAGGTGGAAGLAIQTNGNSITYITTGTINGAVS